MGKDCSTGVALLETPTGEKIFFGEFLINAQGEDVLWKERRNILQKSSNILWFKRTPMEEVMPKVYQQLAKVFVKLEKHYRDMQDIEFTVENKKL